MVIARQVTKASNKNRHFFALVRSIEDALDAISVGSVALPVGVPKSRGYGFGGACCGPAVAVVELSGAVSAPDLKS